MATPGGVRIAPGVDKTDIQAEHLPRLDQRDNRRLIVGSLAHRALSHGSAAVVLLVGDVVSPVGCRALISGDGFGDGQLGHEVNRCGAGGRQRRVALGPSGAAAARAAVVVDIYTLLFAALLLYGGIAVGSDRRSARVRRMPV